MSVCVSVQMCLWEPVRGTGCFSAWQRGIGDSRDEGPSGPGAPFQSVPGVMPWEGTGAPRSCSRPPEPGSRIFSVSPPEHPVLPDLHAFAFRTPSLPSLRGAVTEAVDFLTVGGQGLSWRGPVPSLPNFSKGESAWYFLFSRDKNYYALTMCQKIYIPVPYFLTTVF